MQEREFPNFDDLPDYDSPWGNFYEEEDGILSPVRHWCFLGEIKEFTQVLRPRVSQFTSITIKVTNQLHSLGMRFKKGKQWQFYMLNKRAFLIAL